MDQTSGTEGEQGSPPNTETETTAEPAQVSQLEGRASSFAPAPPQAEQEGVSFLMVAIFILLVIALALTVLVVLKLLGFSLFT